MYKPGYYHIGQLKIGNAFFVGVTAGVYSVIPESLDRRIARVGVYGNAFDSYDPKAIGIDIDKVRYKAQLIGELIAKEGFTFVNGACSGFPNIAAQGSKSKNGIVTGFSRYEDEKTHITEYRINRESIPHHLIAYLGKEEQVIEKAGIQRSITRDVANIFSSDAIIVIGGLYGTNHEVAIATLLGLPISLLRGTGGVADHAMAYYKSIEKPSSTVFIEEETPQILIERLVEELSRRGKFKREFKPGQDPLDTILHKIELQQAAYLPF